MFHIPTLKNYALVVFFWLFFCHQCPEAAVPNIFGTRDQFHGRQSFCRSGVGWFWDESSILHCLNWNIIILQCCIRFCHAKARASHVYTHIPSLGGLPPTLPDPTPRGHHRAPSKLPELCSSFLLPDGMNWEISINILVYTQPCALHLACTSFLLLLHQLLLRSSGIRSWRWGTPALWDLRVFSLF